MFQFPAFAPTKSGYPAFNWMGSPIRTSPGQGLFAPNRCFSQLTASFFASLSLGIHRPPFCFPYFYYLRLSLKEIRLLDLLSLVQYVKDRMESCIPTVENKGLEPLTPCVQGRCSKPTELIPQDTGTYKVNTVVPGRVDA